MCATGKGLLGRFLGGSDWPQRVRLMTALHRALEGLGATDIRWYADWRGNPDDAWQPNPPTE